MIKVKTFIIKNSSNPLHHSRLDNQINDFIAKNNVEVIDIKYSTSVSANANGGVNWIPSAMLIYNAKKQLKDFNSTELSRIIKELGSVPRIFNSEAQFQFELAWKINEQFNCTVKLEELSRTYKNGQKNKTEYTDIILEDETLRIGIELKYKTKKLDKPEMNVHLKQQGAHTDNRKLFLEDVDRLDALTQSNITVQQPCGRGYAVMLTNDQTYCGNSVNAINQNCIHHCKIFDWDDYCEVQGTNGKFKFIIVEIP